MVFPGGAERLGPEEGTPPAIAVYQGDKVVAYVFSTLDIIAAPGYSTTPFDVIAGVDLGGRITGAKVVFHNEPYILHDVAASACSIHFSRGRPAGRCAVPPTTLPPDFVAGATVSARAMRAAITHHRRAGAAPACWRGPSAAAPTLDVEAFTRKSWDSLVAAGAVTRDGSRRAMSPRRSARPARPTPSSMCRSAAPTTSISTLQPHCSRRLRSAATWSAC